MIDALGDILGNKRFEEPPEIAIIKKFVKENFKTDVSVTMHARYITIHAPNSAFAASLQMQLHELQRLVGSNRRLAIRIGN